MPQTALPTSPDPMITHMPLPRAVPCSVLSRTTLYRLARDGQVHMVKSGRSTLVDWRSVQAHLASFPVWPPLK